MSFLYDQQKVHQQKLERFRQSFLILTQDGQYPPERQSRLYQATIDAGLDWNEARRFVRQEAEQLFDLNRNTLLSQGPISPEAMAELNRLRRRLHLDAVVTVSIPQTPPVIPKPAPGLRTSTAPTFWSDLKMIVGVILLTPIIWISLGFLTLFGFAFLSMFIGPDISSKVAPPVVMLEFFPTIFLAVRAMRRWRRPTHYSQRRSPRPPVYTPPPLPINQYAPHVHQPRSLLSGSALASSVQHLSGPEFEHWVKDRLEEMGWQQLRVMGGRGDRGVDIRGVYHGKKCIVQCKHYRGRLVPPGEVRALVGTRNIQRAQRAYLVTSGKFGYQCFHEVNNKPVELWDLETLATHLNNQTMMA